MIYTVTLNPCLDYVMKTEKLALGETNRSGCQEIYPGGKGINVSIVLKNLGMESKALGFVGGFTGREIKKRLEENKIETDFIELDGRNSRINVKLKGETETEINASGPEVTAAEFEQLLSKLEVLKEDDVLVLTGNTASGMDEYTYARILERMENKRIVTVVDASGNLLVNTLKYKPFLIKPNLAELEGLFGCSISVDEVEKYAKKLQNMGAMNVLVSLGKDGAALVSADGKYRIKTAPRGTVVNSVGAGDSMVAGFIYECLDGGDFDAAFNLAIAAGSATAFTSNLANKDEIYSLFTE